MGKIKEIYSEKEIGPGFYDRSSRLEIHEKIHFHLNEFRFIWDKETFLKMIELFKEAEMQYYALACPEETSDMHLLAREDNFPKQLSHNRIAVEEQKDGKIHLHIKDLRIHLGIGDLYVFCETFDNAFLALSEDNKKIVEVSSLKYHPVVNEYIGCLLGYKEPISNWKQLKRTILRFRSLVGDWSKRNLGFPEGYPGKIDREVQKEYLYTLYKDVLKKGIQSPIVCYKLDDGLLQVINSHRFAIVKFMELKLVDVIVVEKESNWKE